MTTWSVSKMADQTVNDLQQSISNAVSTVVGEVLSRTLPNASTQSDTRGNPPPSSSASSSRKHTTTGSFMPSKFLKKKMQPTLKEKITKVWTKDIICLPNEYESEKEDIVIPRGSRRIELARLGLVGKVSLCSSMDFGEVQEEVRSVFKDSMGHKPSFAFKFLQPVGGGCRSLFDPQTSASFAWSAKDVVQSAGRGAICWNSYRLHSNQNMICVMLTLFISHMDFVVLQL